MNKIDKAIAEARKIEAKAMPMPWQPVSSLPAWAVAGPKDTDVCSASGREYRRPIKEKHGCYQTDAEFIAYSRNNLPKFIDALERAVYELRKTVRLCGDEAAGTRAFIALTDIDRVLGDKNVD